MYQIALATCSELPHLTADDQLLIPALAERGWTVTPAVWDAPDVPWSDFDAVVIRSTWDYHRRLPEFVQWTRSVGSTLLNEPQVVEWNCHKEYLAELRDKGIPIVPTVFSGIGEIPEVPWEKAVVKPAVSATAHNTWICEGDFERLSAHAQREDLLVQPFLEEIQTEGELSLIYIGGKFSHSVIKRAKAGDFRVQNDFGGTSELVEAPGPALETGEKLAALKPGLLYARVDGVMVRGQFLLMEWELIEPSLFLGDSPDSVEKFAAALVQQIANTRHRRLQGLGAVHLRD